MLRKIATIAALGFGLSAGAASAATVYAQEVTGFGGILGDGGSSTCSIAAGSDSRDNLCNALGAPDQDSANRAAGGFLSAGKYDALKFTFGDGVSFSGPITFFEISFNTPETNRESITFLLTGDGGAQFLTIDKLPNPTADGDFQGDLENVAGTRDETNSDRWILSAAEGFGPFDALWVFDTSGTPDGFDIDAISAVSVSPVPLPAAGFLLIAGLGGLAAMRRRG